MADQWEEFVGYGIRFQFPHDWEVTRTSDDREVTLTVTSPSTAFWSLSLYYDRPDPERVIGTATAAFQEEYQNLDVYESDEEIGGEETVSRDIEFFCLELLNSAWLRAFATPRFTGLVFYQATDLERAELMPVFERLCRSLEWEDADDPLWSPFSADL